MNTALDSSLSSLRRISRVTEAGARDLARKSNMATTELLTLQQVADNPSISPGSLAKSLSLSPVTSTVILQKLEAKGLIHKIKSPSDKRRLEVHLTPEGLREVSSAPSNVQNTFMENFEKLPAWEQHQIAAVLGKITALLNAENLEASPILQVGSLT